MEIELAPEGDPPHKHPLKQEMEIELNDEEK